MSIWTHVAGVIRIDGLDEDFNWDELLGKEVGYNDSYDVWEDAGSHPNEYMPCGSEGSLEKSIWKNPDEHCLAAYTVSVFGDLRDYDDLDAIVKWFEQVCKKLWVRNAVLTAECENGRVVNVYWDSETDKLVQSYSKEEK